MMIQLEKEEYDLNILFSFETLKIILFKLANSQIKLTEEIKQIKKSNLNRDKIIQKIGTSIGEDVDIQDQQLETNIDLDYNENSQYKENTNKSKEKENRIDKEEQNNINIDLPKKVDNIVNNIEVNSENIPKEINNNLSNNLSNVLDSKIKENNINLHIYNQSQEGNNLISSELFSKMANQLKNQQSKLSVLEKKINTDSKTLKNFENNYKNQTLNNDSEFKLVNEKISNLLEKAKDYEHKLENLQVKMSELDVFSMFKDNGDGTIDATKIMIKSLEEKIFKKFDLLDKRYKIDSLENAKTKSNVDNILPKLDLFHREIERINEIENKNQEDFEAYKKENDELNAETKNDFNNNLNKVIDELKEEFENLLNNKISLIENKIKDIKINYGDNFDILKFGGGNNDINQETIDALEKKISDLRKKTNDIENIIKLYMNRNITDSINNEIKDIKFILDKKITKDDLKELYNYHLNIVDEINDLKDQETSSYDELRKTIKNLQNLQQRVESINGNISLLQKNPRSGGPSIVDFGKYIDQQKLSDTLRPILKEFEKVYREMESIRRDASVNLEENSKKFKSAINKLDEEINNRINEFKNHIQKRYIEKTEFNKIIKSFEVQIKSLGEENKKDSDSWLLAKRPLKCFNCASCEANIKDDYSVADYLAWKKYPRGEKIHRMGQGFSHMLQMMTSEFVKSIEKNEFPQDFEMSSRNNNLSTQFNDKHGGFIINNKYEFINNLKKFSKMKLPKVKQFSNPKIKIKKFEEALPVSDDENNYLENYNNNLENEIRNSQNSPKILKIKKKEKSNFGKGSVKNIYNNLITTQENLFSKDRNLDLGRNKMVYKTEKNTFESNEVNNPNN